MYDGPPYKAERAPSGRYHIFVPGEHYVGSFQVVGKTREEEQKAADQIAEAYTRRRDWPFRVYEKHATDYFWKNAKVVPAAPDQKIYHTHVYDPGCGCGSCEGQRP